MSVEHPPHHAFYPRKLSFHGPSLDTPALSASGTEDGPENMHLGISLEHSS